MSLPRTPGPDEVVIHLNTSDGQKGPYSRRTVQTMLESGEVSTSTHFWFDGMSEWVTLATHADLLENLGAGGGLTPRAPGENDDDYKDRLFGELIKGSWDYLYDHAYAGHIDEVFLGAVITSTLDAGYSLIDINSDGSNHYLRFQDLESNARIIFRLHHLTGSLAVAKVLGQRASVIVGYGEKVKNVSKIMTAMRAEMQSGYIQNAEPGTITVDGDLQSGYVYVQVDMFWNIDDYVSPTYQIDYKRLTGHIDACTHALRKYLRGRFA